MISAAISALSVSGALAQATEPGSRAGNQPAAAEASHMNDPHFFLQAQTADQWAFSKFKGTDVLGPDNKRVGDVTDIIFDKHGKILGLVVGVGGFLGIGEKNVAIDLNAFKVVPYSTGINVVTTPSGGATTGTSATTNNNAAALDNDPTRAKLQVTWTKDQLKAAPDFQYYRVANTQRPAAPTTGMAPRPATPAAPAPR
jgi:sporulation protein YlmC with PRC-barrel domain